MRNLAWQYCPVYEYDREQRFGTRKAKIIQGILVASLAISVLTRVLDEGRNKTGWGQWGYSTF